MNHLVSWDLLIPAIHRQRGYVVTVFRHRTAGFSGMAPALTTQGEIAMVDTEQWLNKIATVK